MTVSETIEYRIEHADEHHTILMDDGQIHFWGRVVFTTHFRFFRRTRTSHSHLTNPTIMGITDFSKALFKLIGLDLDHVVNAARALAKERGREDSPTIYIDASIAGYKFGRYDGQDASVGIKIFVEILLKEGFQVFVVFDPPHRHHSKVASIERAGKREESRLLALRSRADLIRLSDELSMTDTSAAAERAEIEQKMTELEKKIQKCENYANNSLLPGFSETTIEALESVDLGSRGGTMTVLTTRFQYARYRSR